MKISKKRSFKKRLTLAIAPTLFKWWFAFSYLTSKVEYIGKEHIDEQLAKGSNWIFATWHMNTAMGSYSVRKYRPVAMTSTSFDGEMISRVMESIGFSTVRGSSSEHGAKALIGMIKILKKGRNGAITPDGPRGPAYEVSPGTVAVAQKTGLPVLPFHAVSSKMTVFEKSWDQHLLPRPFGHMIISFGEPIYFPKNLSKEEVAQACLDLRDKINENKEKCELALAKLSTTKG